MTEHINVREYTEEPLVELVVPRTHKWNYFEATVWRLRQPVEADYFRAIQVATAFEARRAAYVAEKAEAGKALGMRAARMAEERVAANPDVDPDPELRAFMARESVAMSGPDPVNITARYKLAETLAVFIEPPQSPERILSLGPDIMAYLDGKLAEAYTGEAAKKRLAPRGASSPEPTSTASTPSSASGTTSPPGS